VGTRWGSAIVANGRVRDRRPAGLPRFCRLIDQPSMPRSARSREPRTRTRIKFFRILFVALGLAFISGISILFGMMMAVAPDVKGLSNEQEFKTAVNTTLTDRKGNFLAELTPSDGRVILDPKDISKTMKQAVVAIEDKRFYQHQGVDLRGLGRAFFTDVLEGKPTQGASTIEQQFIKVVSKDQNERTISNKIRETALAYHLSHKWSKAKILTEYLNSIYYGNGAYGIESAARTYFSEAPNMAGCGKRTDPCALHLDAAQSAFLAGIINSPTAYDPVANPVDSQRRRDLVLAAMRDQSLLNPIQYSDALATSIPPAETVHPPRLRLANEGDGYFVDWVRSQLAYKFSPREAFEGGLKVRTTIDPDMQGAAQASINTWLSGVGPSSAMVVIDNASGEVRAMVGGQDYYKKPFNLATQGRRQPGSSFKPFVLAEALKSGIAPTSTWVSKKRTFKVGKNEDFVVNNYGDRYTGVTTLARATAFSDNSVFAQVGIKVGTKKIATLSKQMGVRTPVSSNYAITLGGLKTGVTPLDMAHAYESFASGGKRIYGTLAAPNAGPVGIKEIKRPQTKGKKVLDNQIRTRRVLPDSIARETTNILTGVVSIGSGKAAAIPGHVVWGKTGTTDNNGDAWFVGSTEGLTVAVWVGYADQTKPMLTEYRGEPVDGGTYPAQIWHTFMLKAIGIEQARHDAFCAQKAKTKKPCEEDVAPTTPTGTTVPGLSGSDVPSSTSGGGAATGDTGGTGTGGTGTTGGGTAGGTGTGTGTAGTGTGGAGTGGGTPTPAPVTPATPVTPPAQTPTPGGGTNGAGGVAPGT
jgi:penicillin-binding protein 1A